MSRASFSIFLAAGADPQHPKLAAALENIRVYRSNETTADREIAILRIGESPDPGLHKAYLDWMAANLGITDAPSHLRDRHHHILKALLASGHGVTEQARTRMEHTLRNPSAVAAPRDPAKDRFEGQ